MALEGTLKDFALPDIFQLIGLQKKTGMLLLNDKDDEVTIAFKDGELVSAESRKRRLEERLGTRLVKSGLITEGQLHDALEKQKQTLQRLGVILTGEQLVRKEDLKRALEIQMTQVVYRVFRWEDAYYRFDQDAAIDYDRENVVPMPAEGLLMEGMRILDEWPIVEKVVRSTQAVYEKVPVSLPIEVEREEIESDDDDFDFDLGSAAPKPDVKPHEAIKLSAQEGAVYKWIDGQRTVEDLMYAARLSDFDTSKAIYDLVNRDLIREQQAKGARSSATQSISIGSAEASPVLVYALLLVVLGLAGVGAFFFEKNPLNTTPLGLMRDDLARQHEAAIASRLDHVTLALEAYRLASPDQLYPVDLDELVDLGYLRDEDVQNPWGVHFDYSRLEGGQSFRLQAVDEENQELPDLERTGGEAEAPATGF